MFYWRPASGHLPMCAASSDRRLVNSWRLLRCSPPRVVWSENECFEAFSDGELLIGSASW